MNDTDRMTAPPRSTKHPARAKSVEPPVRAMELKLLDAGAAGAGYDPYNRPPPPLLDDAAG